MKRKPKKFLSLLIAMIMIISLLPAMAYADETSDTVQVTVGDGEKTSTYIPCYSYYKYGKAQYIIPGDMLSDIEGMKITALKWYLSVGSQYRVFDVILSETTEDTITELKDVSASAVVFSGEVQADTEVLITFDTPYQYSGGNLLVTILDNTGNYGSMPHNTYIGTSGSSITTYRDNGAFGADYTGSGSLQNFMPKTTLICEPGPVIEYPLYVAGTQVTSLNARDLSVIDGVDVASGGSAKYDKKTNTLILNGTTITGLDSESIGITDADGGIVYSGTDDLTIKVTGGASTITGGSTKRSWSTGLFIGHPEEVYESTTSILPCSVTIDVSEGASVAFIGGVPQGGDYPCSYGICGNSLGQVTITGAGNLSANGSSAAYSYGISTAGGLVIDSSGTVNASGADTVTVSLGIAENSYYMIDNRGLIICGSGTVNAASGTAAALSAGIYAYSKNGILIDAAKGTVNAIGEWAGGTGYETGSYGIFSYNTIKVEKGNVKAQSLGVGAADTVSAGLFAQNSSEAVIDISGGTVEAYGGAAPAPEEASTINSAGICSAGAVKISGSSTAVTAEGLLAGIYAKGADITVSGGTVNANAKGDTTIADHGYNGLGIYADSTGKIIFSGEGTVVSAKGRKTSVFTLAGITIESPLAIVLPEGGKLSFANMKIVESDGSTNATDVLIKKPDPPAFYTLTITKTWEDDSDAAGMRPDDLSVTVNAVGKIENGETYVHTSGTIKVYAGVSVEADAETGEETLVVNPAECADTFAGLTVEAFLDKLNQPGYANSGCTVEIDSRTYPLWIEATSDRSADLFYVEPETAVITTEASGWNKDGNTWTYELTVPSSTGSLEMWEALPEGYEIDGRGTESDPIKLDVSGDVTASLTNKIKTFTVTFVNEDGTELQSGQAAYGMTPVYSGETPAKAATAQYSYEFDGWTPEIVPVTEDATYTAVYKETVNKYTVRFENWDGTELQSGEYAYGETPAYTGETPTRPDDDTNTYTFSGWNPEIVPVTGDATYTAAFKAEEIPSPPPAPENEIIRLAGPNRYDTALAAAEHLKDGKFSNIIIASGKDFPDALSATYLAYVKEAPILLVGNPDSITKVSAYINENLAEGGTVYIIGGTGAVPAEVDGKIKGTVKRLAGSNRYATNIEVLKEAGIGETEILIASGKGYADALSASAAGRPILLVGNALTADQKTYLAENKASLGGKSYIVGGTGAVSDAVEKDLKNYFTGDMVRFAGKNRYETSEMVAKEFFKGEVDTMVIASGKDFPDGLSGGPVAAAYKAPLLLVTDGVVDHAKSIFTDKGMYRLVVMGGTGAVSKAIAEDIAAPTTEAE